MLTEIKKDDNSDSAPYDQYKVFTVGLGSQIFPLNPFSNTIEEFVGFDVGQIRSKPYTKIHDGKHILFAGCSVTAGVGIEDEMDIWSSIVFTKIKEKEKVSGFYSVAWPAHSVTSQVSMIMRYISEYGKPDVIFFNLPSTGRTFSVSEDNQLFLSQVSKYHETYYPGSITLAQHTNYESYFFLHTFCKEAGIRLISITWSDYATNSDAATALDLFKDKFDSFYISKVKIEDYLEEYLMSHKGENLLFGTDGRHPGIALHAYYASTALEAYLDLPA
jgi:hypothetical protein